MPSPFPGMDPFIEGVVWEDFHHGFIAELSAAMVPLVRPRYLVRREHRVYVEHDAGDEDRVLRADVAVTLQKREPAPAAGEAASLAAPVAVHLPIPAERREGFLTIRDRKTMEVVTVVELLSPANKRAGSDGRRQYISKRQEILGSETHLVELDLLRGGLRLPTVEPLPPADYYALVCRNHPRSVAEVYPWTLRLPLPQIPIPLAGGDPDVLVDLQPVFTATYDRAGYDYSLDYGEAIDPPLSKPDVPWAAEIVAGREAP